MWPFNKKKEEVTEHAQEAMDIVGTTVAAGINWQEILSEGKSVELFDGCRAKCDGTFEDL